MSWRQVKGPANGAAYLTGPNNQLLFDGVFSYLYDPEGNRTARFIDVNANGLLDAGDTAATTYAWDHRNRLTRVTDYAAYGDPATRAIDYLYDTENRWIGRDVDLGVNGQIDSQTRFAYDGNQIVLQFDRAIAPTDDPADPLTQEDLSHRYLWNPAAVDQLMADEQVTDPDIAGDIVWPLGDHQGTIRDLAVYDSATDTTTVVNHRTFDAYGKLQSQTNPAVDCLFAYTGRPIDETTGLQNNLNRWYDATTGRWMSEDPVGFEGRHENLYAYVGNGPVNAVDPSGLYSFTKPNGFLIIEGVLVRVDGGRVTIRNDYTGEERTFNIADFSAVDQAYIKAWKWGQHVFGVDVPDIDYYYAEAMQSSVVPHFLVLRGENGEFRISSLAIKSTRPEYGELNGPIPIFGRGMPLEIGPLFNVTYRATDSRELLGLVVAVQIRGRSGYVDVYGVPTQASGFTVAANYASKSKVSPFWAHPQYGGVPIAWPGGGMLATGTVNAKEVSARCAFTLRTYQKHRTIIGGERFEILVGVMWRNSNGNVELLDCATWRYSIGGTRASGEGLDGLTLQISQKKTEVYHRNCLLSALKLFNQNYPSSGWTL